MMDAYIRRSAAGSHAPSGPMLAEPPGRPRHAIMAATNDLVLEGRLAFDARWYFSLMHSSHRTHDDLASDPSNSSMIAQ
jgi:hypothetical protein